MYEAVCHGNNLGFITQTKWLLNIGPQLLVDVCSFSFNMLRILCILLNVYNHFFSHVLRKFSREILSRSRDKINSGNPSGLAKRPSFGFNVLFSAN